NVVIDIAEGKLVGVDVVDIHAYRLPIHQPAVALLDCVKRRLKPAKKGPKADARSVEISLVLERKIVATACRRSADEIEFHHRKRLPAQQHAVEATEHAVGIECLAAGHHAQIPILQQ